jgi:hypothetical protein
MSRVSISKSYAVLVGMEGYTRTKRKVKNIEQRLEHDKDKILHPEKVKQQDEQLKDKSESAEKERQYLEHCKLKDGDQGQGHAKGKSLSFKLARMLRLHGKEDGGREKPGPEGRNIPGGGPEDGVPPPEGKR